MALPLQPRWQALNYPSQAAYESSNKDAQVRLGMRGFSTPIQPSSVEPTAPQSRLPALSLPPATAPVVTPPMAAPAVLAQSSTPQAASSGRLPIGFSDAGFTSQAEYDAAKAGPQTTFQGVPSRISSLSPEMQAAHDAAMIKYGTPQVPQNAGGLGAVIGWMPGANRTFNTNARGEQIDPANSRGTAVMTKDTSEGDAFVARHDAFQSQQAQAAQTRLDNIAAAKKLPDSDPGSFAAKRATFNNAALDRHMDADGNIVQASKAEKDHFTTLDAADASVRAAQAKAEAVKSQAVSKLAADTNKAEKARQKAADDAAKAAAENAPAAVSQRLSAIIPPPAQSSAPSGRTSFAGAFLAAAAPAAAVMAPVGQAAAAFPAIAPAAGVLGPAGAVLAANHVLGRVLGSGETEGMSASEGIGHYLGQTYADIKNLPTKVNQDRLQGLLDNIGSAQRAVQGAKTPELKAHAESVLRTRRSFLSDLLKESQ